MEYFSGGGVNGCAKGFHRRIKRVYHIERFLMGRSYRIILLIPCANRIVSHAVTMDAKRLLAICMASVSVISLRPGIPFGRSGCYPKQMKDSYAQGSLNAPAYEPFRLLVWDAPCAAR